MIIYANYNEKIIVNERSQYIDWWKHGKAMSNVMKEVDMEKSRLHNAANDRIENQNFSQEKAITVIEIREQSYYIAHLIRNMTE